MEIQLPNKLGLLIVGIHHAFRRPICIIDRGNPNTPEFVVSGLVNGQMSLLTEQCQVCQIEEER
jgi:putative hemolysin